MNDQNSDRKIPYEIVMRPIERLRSPKHPIRKGLNVLTQAALKESIDQHDLTSLPIVRPTEDYHFDLEVVVGWERCQAAAAAGYTEILVIVMDMDDLEALERSLADNLKQRDLTPVEILEAIIRIIEMRLGLPKAEATQVLRETLKQLRRLKKSETPEQESVVLDTLQRFGMQPKSFRANYDFLINAPLKVYEAIQDGLDLTKAKLLAKIEDEDTCQDLLEKTLSLDWSRERLKQAIKALQPQTQPINDPQVAESLEVANELRAATQDVLKYHSALSEEQIQELRRLINQLRDTLAQPKLKLVS